MGINISQRAIPAPELIATMTGSDVIIGTLVESPVILIFDNQGTVSVVISINGVEWKTFPGGEALVIDFRANHGIACNFTLDRGTVISGNGASGDFSISYFYAQNN